MANDQRSGRPTTQGPNIFIQNIWRQSFRSTESFCPKEKKHVFRIWRRAKAKTQAEYMESNFYGFVLHQEKNAQFTTYCRSGKICFTWVKSTKIASVINWSQSHFKFGAILSPTILFKPLFRRYWYHFRLQWCLCDWADNEMVLPLDEQSCQRFHQDFIQG